MPTYLDQTFFWGYQEEEGVQSLVQAAKQINKYCNSGQWGLLYRHKVG